MHINSIHRVSIFGHISPYKEMHTQIQNWTVLFAQGNAAYIFRIKHIK